MRATITASGNANPAIVWGRYENLDLWPTWSPQIQEVISATTHLAPGLTGLVVGPLGVRVPFEITAVDAEAMEWSWHVRFGPVHLMLEHLVAPAAAGSTTELTIDGPAVAVVGYRPLAALALRRLVQRDL
jgi:hypothetical protein